MKNKHISNNLLFSIIVPIYNVDKWLEKCLNSIIIQKCDCFEAILVDDGSTDRSSDICDLYSTKYKNIKTVHKKNGGLVSARNCGIKQATGKYIIYVDGDDWIKPNYLSECEKVINNHPDIDLIIFDYECVYKNSVITITKNTYSKVKFYDENKVKKDIYPNLMWNKIKWKIEPSSSNKVFKKELLLEHYCKDESIDIGEDVAYVYEYIFNCKNAYFLNKTLYCYNKQNAASLTTLYGGDPKISLYNYLFKNLLTNKYNKTVHKQVTTYYLHKTANDYIVKPIKSNHKYRDIKKNLKKLKILSLINMVKINNIQSKNYILFYFCARFKAIWIYYITMKIKTKSYE